KEHHSPAADRQIALSVRGLADGVRVHDCSFDLYKGEALGLAGLVGSGRTELARLIFGADRTTSGSVALEGTTRDSSGPRDAIESGIAYLTEDRKVLGLFLDMSIADNVSISVLGNDASAKALLNREASRRRAKAAVHNLSIRAAGISINAGALSGGNQQKVLLA